MAKKIPDVEKLISEILSDYNQRAAQVVVERYGLKSGKTKTLAEIGKNYGITRERVRQIEAVALEDLKEKIEKNEEAQRLSELVNDYLDGVGKVRRGDLLAKDLMLNWGVDAQETVFANRLNFLAELLEDPYVSYGDDRFHDVWYNDEKAYDLAKKVVIELLRVKEHDFEKFVDSTASKFKLPTFLIVNYVNISKDFGVGPYGDLGAKHWLHVNPKTIRDKSYLVLNRSERPLHFREVAGMISKLGKKAHPGTVHNELIKDPRFIWTKRGTYGLKEHL